MKRFSISLILIFLIIGLSFIFLNCRKSNSEDIVSINISQTNDDTIQPEKSKDTITVVAVGDIMLGTNYPTNINYLPPNDDCSALWAPVVKYLRDADLTFGNCEGTFNDHPEYVRGCNSDNCYRFSMPTKYVHCFVDAGFDVLSNANNHVADAGTFGKKSTLKTIKDAGLHSAGLVEKPTDTFSINGVKWGFCAFAPNEGTCQINDYKKMQQTVSMLKKECDLVLVSFHGGAEGHTHEHVTRAYETFLGQNRGNVYEFAHKAIDAGADLVIGQGPHVTRAVELYKGKFIAYSLGNFCTYRRFNLKGVNGIAPIVKIWVDSNGDFIKAKIIPVYQDKMTGTHYDELGRVIKRMQELTKEDFPEGVLNISDDGWITKIEG